MASTWLSPAPALMPVKLMICNPANSVIARLFIGSRAGRSFTGFTFNMNALVAEPPLLSLTVTLMVALPNWLASGVRVIVRLLALPPKVILPFGISAGFEELPLTFRLLAGVSASPMVKAMAGLAVSSSIVWSAIGDSVGGLLAKFI